LQHAQTLLKKIFGYNSFRPLQSEIIANVLNKKDTLVIMPTGGGKSLCYQIPALIFGGLTVVISPLISLMKDQVEQLKQNGINAVMLNSSLSQREYRQNFISVKTQKAKLLYIAPESFVKEVNNDLFSGIIVDCLTVDEAHCISEWGHDFRPVYRQHGKMRNRFPGAVCIGLTATATPRVQNDIMNNLNLKDPSKFLASFNRENLFLQVVPKTDAYQQTHEFLKQHKDQSGIIYCFSRKQVDELYEDLSRLGYSCRPYHAGLTDKERSANQDLFTRDEVQIIVATIAFGMGINKSNVRFVIHYDLPKNIESYYQEIGRSGRDGLRSDCLLLFSYSDISKINYFIDQKEDPIEKLAAKAHLQAMIRYAESEMCRRVPLITYFGEKHYSENCGMCDNCISDKNYVDITIPAQKILSSIKRTGEVFGVSHIVDVLTGQENEKIISYNHQNLTVFGIGKEYSKKQWMRISNQLIQRNLIYRDFEFGSLKLTSKASSVLFKGEKVFGRVEEAEIDYRKGKADIQPEHDELFELLRQKRKEIAARKSIPPYVVFSDKTLTQMALEKPQDRREMLRISGLGTAKYEAYGTEFLEIIRDFTKGNHHKKSSDSERKPKYILISEQFNSGKSLAELEEQYQLKRSTILAYLLKYLKLGNKLLVNNLDDVRVNESDRIIINKYFKEYGTEILSPLFQKLNERVSYDDLHILRIKYFSDSNKQKWINIK